MSVLEYTSLFIVYGYNMHNCMTNCVQDDALEKSVTFQGEMSRQNMPLEARMNRLENEMIEMREVGS